MRIPHWAFRLGALFAGLLLTTTTPPWNFTWGVPLGLILFASALSYEELTSTPMGPSRMPGALRGYLFGFGANLVALRFVPLVVTTFTSLNFTLGCLALALLALFQALPYALAGVLYRRLRALGMPLPLAFGSAIFVGHFVPGVFPWTPVGGLSAWPLLLQHADIIGERGISALLCILCASVSSAAIAWRQRPARYVWIARFLPLALAMLWAPTSIIKLHAERMQRAARSRVRIGLIQPGTAAKLRWESDAAPAILRRLQVLSESAEHRGAEITVWPEAAYPYALAHESRLAPLGEREIFNASLQKPILFGLILQTGHGDTTNATAVATRDGQLSAPSDKRFLLAFGEHIPLAEELPWLKRTFARGGGMLPGTTTALQHVGPVRAAILNCFEDTRTDAGVQLAKTDGEVGNLLVNVTNDAWFFGTFESELHARLAILRAIEHRRDLVRAVNLGPNGIVYSTGEVGPSYASAIPGSLLVTAALNNGSPTFFARFGDGSLAWLLFASVIGLLARKRQLPLRPNSEIHA